MITQSRREMNILKLSINVLADTANMKTKCSVVDEALQLCCIRITNTQTHQCITLCKFTVVPDVCLLSVHLEQP